ncbi:MAG: SpoIIE family protein phosphatase [Acidimicrobiales bacterium]
MDDSPGMRDTLTGMLEPYWEVPATAEAAILLISAHSHSDSVVAGLDAGADGFLTKPFTREELLARVRTHMKMTQVRAELSDRVALLQAQIESAPQAFLLSAAQALARSTTYVETVANLAEVAVPTLGDICLIDVKEEPGGGLRRMASRHVDPDRQALVDQLATEYPLDPQGGHPSIQVLSTGRSVWSETMPDGFLRATSRDEEHFRIIKELDFTSFMTVPLTDRGEVLGAMTLVSACSGRRFGPRDLSLAEDLAGQVAAVVGKARRYEQEHLAAHTLQSTLLPSALPVAPGLSVAVRYLPGTRGAEVGAVRSGLRALMRHAEDPASLVELLQFSWDDLGVDRMTTLVVVFVDGPTGEYTVASAGHPPPLLVPAVGRPRFLPVEPATPLGCPPMPVAVHRGQLEPGDLLLLYSDGLIETREASIVDGLEHLAELATGIGTHPERFCSRILSRLDRERTERHRPPGRHPSGLRPGFGARSFRLEREDADRSRPAPDRDGWGPGCPAVLRRGGGGGRLRPHPRLRPCPGRRPGRAPGVGRPL